MIALMILPYHVQSVIAQSNLNILGVEYSPNGQYIAGFGNTLVIWDGTDGSLVTNLGTGSQSATAIVADVNWSPDSNRLATVSDDSFVRIWDFSASAQPFGALIVEFDPGIGISVENVVWSPDGSQIAVSGQEQNGMAFWDANTYQFIRKTPYPVISLDAEWNPDPQRELIAVATFYDYGAQLVNTNPNAPRSDVILCVDCQLEPSGELFAGTVDLAWNSDGSKIAVGNTTGNIHIFDTDTQQAILSIQTSDHVSEIAWSADDQYIASVSQGNLQIWDATNGELLADAGFASRIAVNPVTNDLFVFDTINDEVDITPITSLVDFPPKLAASNPLTPADDAPRLRCVFLARGSHQSPRLAPSPRFVH